MNTNLELIPTLASKLIENSGEQGDPTVPIIIGLLLIGSMIAAASVPAEEEKNK